MPDKIRATPLRIRLPRRPAMAARRSRGLPRRLDFPDSVARQPKPKAPCTPAVFNRNRAETAAVPAGRPWPGRF